MTHNTTEKMWKRKQHQEREHTNNKKKHDKNCVEEWEKEWPPILRRQNA